MYNHHFRRTLSNIKYKYDISSPCLLFSTYGSRPTGCSDVQEMNCIVL